MSSHYLVLHPLDPKWSSDSLSGLQHALEHIGFMGEARQPGEFLAGTEYLSLVTYLGCSPQISLGEAEAATRIYLRRPDAMPRLNAGANIKPPRCKTCRQTIPLADAKLQLQTCPHCGQPLKPDWRRSAAMGRIFIEISNVHESEAVPGETLLKCLHDATGVIWDYCYIRRDCHSDCSSD